MTIRVSDRLEMGIDLIRLGAGIITGSVIGFSAHWEITGVGRISYTRNGGEDDIELAGVEVEDDPENPTPSTAPGKGQP